MAGIQFDETVNNTGICQQARILARVNTSQWPKIRIVNSSNHWMDFVTSYAIGSDKRFRFDNTNHTKLPEGETDLVLNQSDYSFLTDEQGNSILTLTGVSLVDANDIEHPLTPVDINDQNFDVATFGKGTGIPTQYDKISDNIIRLDKKATAEVVSAYSLKFRFQRTSRYYTSSDTTQTTGFSPVLDRGFVVSSAYDIALTLGLQNLQALALEREQEKQRVVDYFGNRNEDFDAVLTPSPNPDSQTVNTYF